MDLRNAVTPERLRYLRPLPLAIEFTFAEVSGGPLKIGTVPFGHTVRETVVQILEVFDGGLGITVGDSAAQARFQAITDNKPTHVNHYNVNNVFDGYTSDTEIFVYFPVGNPTTGRAKITVFLD